MKTLIIISAKSSYEGLRVSEIEEEFKKKHEKKVLMTEIHVCTKGEGIEDLCISLWGKGALDKYAIVIVKPINRAVVKRILSYSVHAKDTDNEFFPLVYFYEGGKLS